MWQTIIPIPSLSLNAAAYRDISIKSKSKNIKKAVRARGEEGPKLSNFAK
jgi:hypothetical protein